MHDQSAPKHSSPTNLPILSAHEKEVAVATSPFLLYEKTSGDLSPTAEEYEKGLVVSWWSVALTLLASLGLVRV